MIPYCNYKGIGVIPYAPLLTGHLARPAGSDLTDRAKALVGSPFEKKLREPDIQILRRVEELAHKKGWSMSQVALAWIAAKVTSPIVGVNKVSLRELFVYGLSVEEDSCLCRWSAFTITSPLGRLFPRMRSSISKSCEHKLCGPRLRAAHPTFPEQL